jgi:hypothetical protein
MHPEPDGCQRNGDAAQAEAVFALYLLLHADEYAHLPAITWTVPPTGAGLVGRCTTRVQWWEWVLALGATETSEQERDGRVYLDADVKVHGGRVQVSLIADLGANGEAG